jgi:hypothetical protein
MPLHDWTRVDAGLFHAFHQTWIGALADALNTAGSPEGLFGLLERGDEPGDFVLDSCCRYAEAEVYARRADRIAVRPLSGRPISVVQIVSPGTKSSPKALQAFVERQARLIRHGVHLLVIDPVPPGKGDPRGIHKAIWDEFDEQPFELPLDRRLTLAAYEDGPVPTAYVQPVPVGEALPDMPLFLGLGQYVPMPLEATYQTTWGLFPAELKGLLDPPPPV